MAAMISKKQNAAPAAGKTANTAKTRRKKKSNKKIFFGIGLLVIVLLVWAGLQKAKGTEKFGICQVFVERSMTYPLELKISHVVETATEIDMDFTTTNEYGEYILSNAICTFRPDPKTTWALSDVKVDGNKIEQQKLAVFNSTIPYIMSNLPDLTLPDEISKDLVGLKR